jgi:class 3 adenylate cyclase
MFEESLEDDVSRIFETEWQYRRGRRVPDSESVAMLNDAVTIDAAILYADVVGSSALVARGDRLFAAEVLKAYLHCASKLIKKCRGEITAYDGDRVMAMFIGHDRERKAVETAMRINSAVQRLVNPLLDEFHPDAKYILKHCVGVDAGRVVAVKTGVRGTNELVWVGRCANTAARLSALRKGDVSIWITRRVLRELPDSWLHSDGEATWRSYEAEKIGRSVWGSNMMWE